MIIRSTPIIICICILLASFMGCSQSAKQSEQTTDAGINRRSELQVGGPCDRCEIMYEGMPPEKSIVSEITIAGKTEPGERLTFNGTVTSTDGNPAEDVILYIYHTNNKGFYEPSDTQTAGRRNGQLRSWAKTDAHGEFIVHTIRPAPYPQREVPAHIHILVKEKGKKEYFIDDIWFDDDRLITAKMRQDAENRGGNHILHLAKNQSDEWVGNLKIILGLNIPNYK